MKLEKLTRQQLHKEYFSPAHGAKYPLLKHNLIFYYGLCREESRNVLKYEKKTIICTDLS